MIPPVVEWHLQENSIYGMPSGYAWLLLVLCELQRLHSTYHIKSFVQVPFDNRWNQHTYTSLMLLTFGLWAPDQAYLN